MMRSILGPRKVSYGHSNLIPTSSPCRSDLRKRNRIIECTDENNKENIIPTSSSRRSLSIQTNIYEQETPSAFLQNPQLVSVARPTVVTPTTIEQETPSAFLQNPQLVSVARPTVVTPTTIEHLDNTIKFENYDHDQNISTRQIDRDSLRLFDYVQKLSKNDHQRAIRGINAALSARALKDGLLIHEKASSIAKGNGFRINCTLEKASCRFKRMGCCKLGDADDSGTKFFGMDESIWEKTSLEDLSTEKLNELRKYAQIGENVIESLKIFKLGIKRDHVWGRRGDTLQQAIDSILTAIMPSPNSDEEMLFKQTHLVKELGFKPNVLYRAQNNRKLLEASKEDSSCMPFQVVRSQGMRCDFIDDLIHEGVYAFCHDTEYVRTDSNCSRIYTVKTPSGETEKDHYRLNWENAGTIIDQHSLFLGSIHFKRLVERAQDRNPEFTEESVAKHAHLKKFIHFLCPCVKPKDHAACVDLHQDRVDNSGNAIKQWMSRMTNYNQENEFLEKLFRECPCGLHHEPGQKNWLQIMKGLEDSNDSGTTSNISPRDISIDNVGRKLMNYALCPEKEHRSLICSDKDAKPLKIRDINCAKGYCASCSLSKLPWKCNVVTDCTDKQSIWKWKKDPESSRNNLEKVPSTIPDIFSDLETELEVLSEHDFHLHWQKGMIRLDESWHFEENNGLLVYTDFASNLNFKPPKSECCGQDKHGNLAVFIVLTGRKKIEMVNGEVVVFGQCDYWFGFGGTEKPGKKNDWVFHMAMLDHIVNHYTCKRNKPFSFIRVWTDNCPTQYKCRQNFLHLALLMKKYKIKYGEHCFAAIYGFKGIWDGLGKIIKRILERWCKARDFHVFSAYMAHIVTRNHFAQNLPNNIDWEKEVEKKSIKLKEKTPWQCVNRFSVYVTDDCEDFYNKSIRNPCYNIDPTEEITEAMKNSASGDIIYVNRQMKTATQDTFTVPNTASSFHFRFELNSFKQGEGITKEEESAVLEFLEDPASFAIPLQMAAEVKQIITSLIEEFSSSEDTLETCAFCSREVASSFMNIHECFCEKNELNVEYPLHFRERPCFCTDCRTDPFSRGCDKCKFKEVTGSFVTVNLINKSQGIKRQAIKQIASLVLTQKAKALVLENKIVKIIQSREQSFPSRNILKEDICKWAPIDIPKSINPAAFLKVEDLKAMAAYLCVKVESLGDMQQKRSAPKRADFIREIKAAGGWEAIIAKYNSKII